MMQIAKFISHAGGWVTVEGQEISYSNSKESFENSYDSGFEFIEIDIEETIDGEFVLIHNFFETRKYLFSKEGEVTKEEFLADKMLQGKLTQQTLQDALEFLQKKENLKYVLDIKTSNFIKVLQYIKEILGQGIENIVVQIPYKKYSSLRDSAQNLGYENFICAFYDIKEKDFLKKPNNQEIENIIKEKPLAISFAVEHFKVRQKDIVGQGAKIIVHTVNDFEEIDSLPEIDCFFTDNLGSKKERAMNKKIDMIKPVKVVKDQQEMIEKMRNESF